MARRRPPRLPQLLQRKIYKTGQTRGADDDVIFQNRVSRGSTVLVPFELLGELDLFYREEEQFENGFIVLIKPADYFGTADIEAQLRERGLELGRNTAVFYQIRNDWDAHNPDALGWTPCSSRVAPLGGDYVARIAATTANQGGARINRGFTTSGMKGAGIRLFEYAPTRVIEQCRVQLEAIFWLCEDSIDAVTQYEMEADAAAGRKEYALTLAQESGLLDFEELRHARLTDADNVTVCPLCLGRLSAHGFFNRLAQAAGREVHDLTVTEINLFHIQELRYGVYNHRPYNLGWGHHHCNVVVKDAGIYETIRWMDTVLRVNEESGHYDRGSSD